MSTNFPAAIDTLTNPSGSDALGSAAPIKHSEQHGNANDAIEAVQTVIGITGSTDPASIEKRLVDVINAAATAAADAITAMADAALVAGDLTTHESAGDPHPAYALESALGTAAALNVGILANEVVQLDGTAKLPAVDGSQLTGLSAGVTDHGALTGLADDDHSIYHTDARGDARYAPITKGVTNGDTHDHSAGKWFGEVVKYTVKRPL